jgi:hypothetical protein
VLCLADVPRDGFLENVIAQHRVRHNSVWGVCVLQIGCDERRIRFGVKRRRMNVRVRLNVNRVCSTVM